MGRGAQGRRALRAHQSRNTRLVPAQPLAQELDSAPRSSTGGAAEPTVSLYGLWQTDEWTPPAAEGGRVPRNERGNVEVPPFARALPPGTRHLTAPGLAGLCRALGVDCAPALAGFEPQGGRMVPRIVGVVVCEVRSSGGH